MTRERERLANRRLAETFDIEVGGLKYTVTVGRFSDGRLSEIFLTNGKAGSDADAAARDSGMVASIAFQFGVPARVIRKALLCDARGIASSPLGVALNLLTEDDDA